MSFTEDELQAFNTILERRFAAHRQDMEQALDQRMSDLRHDMDQRLASVHQETVSSLKQWLAEQENRFDAASIGKLNAQQNQETQIPNHETQQKEQQIVAAVDRMLAAQLLGIEQLLNQHVPLHGLEHSSLAQAIHPQLEAIEVQTELPWEDLAEVMGKALDGRLTSLNDSLQRSVKNLEQYLSVRLHSLRDEIVRNQGQPYTGSLNSVASVSEILGGIQQLERIIESMQVAMTANHALLSNRLYHHQQLPLERAHPVAFPHAASANGTNSLLAQAKERIASGLDASPLSRPKEIEEAGGQ